MSFTKNYYTKYVITKRIGNNIGLFENCKKRTRTTTNNVNGF